MTSETGGSLATTPLYDLHIECGAKMVPFAGYSMPINYADGILAEHRHTRLQASLFDVSHMSRIRIAGDNAANALESVCPADIINLGEGRLQYTLLTDENGGIIDDLIVSRNAGDYEIIANAATRQTDYDWLSVRIGDKCEVTINEDYSLLALQGPRSAEVLRELNAGIDNLSFMQTVSLTLAGIACHVSRSGYTGEDGFEISVPKDSSLSLAERMLKHSAVDLAGLGARDGLRLEAGLCLQGQDIDTATTPIEAGLGWCIAQSRRQGGQRAGGFPGADIIFQQMRDSPPRKRVGVLPQGRAPLRTGAVLATASGDHAGVITSGGFSPILQRPVAFAYIQSSLLKMITEYHAQVRGKPVAASVSALPFVPHRYHRQVGH